MIVRYYMNALELSDMLTRRIVWLRSSYNVCPSIGNAIDTALRRAELGHNDIDVLDFYSLDPIFSLLCSAQPSTDVLQLFPYRS
jgi:hypothetical protein